jgi:hypothetical protein
MVNRSDRLVAGGLLCLGCPEWQLSPHRAPAARFQGRAIVVFIQIHQPRSIATDSSWRHSPPARSWRRDMGYEELLFNGFVATIVLLAGFLGLFLTLRL